MELDQASISPEPEAKFVIRISTTVLIASLAFLAWENWKICLAVLGILFHVIMYVQKELEGILKMSRRYTEQLSQSVAD